MAEFSGSGQPPWSCSSCGNCASDATPDAEIPQTVEQLEQECQVAIRDGDIAVESQKAPVLEQDVETCEAANCILSNDLPVAVEASLGQENCWEPLYPGAFLQRVVRADLQVSVRLRDAPGIAGSRLAQAAMRVPDDFGEDFLATSYNFISEEAAAAAEETCLLRSRQKERRNELQRRVAQSILRGQRCTFYSGLVLSGVCMSLMIACAIWIWFNTEEFEPEWDHNEGAVFLRLPEATNSVAVCLSTAFVVLFCLAPLGLACALASFPNSDAQVRELRAAVCAANPELKSYEGDVGEGRSCGMGGIFCAGTTFAIVGVSCILSMCAILAWSKFTAALVVLLSGAALVICCLNCLAYLALPRQPEDERAALDYAMSNPADDGFSNLFMAPMFLAKQIVQPLQHLFWPSKRSLASAVEASHERTIVFKGNVIRGRSTVASWPGKYETAWDALVAGSRQDDISAAVVFLPKGSPDFGEHDTIPARKELKDLTGTCWCTPLYGEEKDWGCRWWTRWIANVERAAQQGCKLEVYYFNGHRGRGKVKNFATAGLEHLRREEIMDKKSIFEETQGFKEALSAGLGRLSKEKGPDSSSPYSREVQRLFLAWLPAEERQFLEESEGLGNSQKAEVAWLKRKGYAFVEKEVSELAASSPKAIGQAANGTGEELAQVLIAYARDQNLHLRRLEYLP